MDAARNGDEVLRVGELEVRPSEYLALARGRALALSVREIELLAALARRQGRVVRREELYESVWGTPLRAHDRSVDVYVHKLRAKLTGALPGWRFIHTHFGLGYRFAPEPADENQPARADLRSHAIHSSATAS